MYAGVPDLPLIKAFAPLLDRLCRVDTLFTVQQLSVPTKANFAASVRLLQMTNFQWGTGAKGNFLEFPSAKKGVDTRA